MKKFFLIMFLSILITSLFGAWLNNIPMKIHQLDGTDISCFASGDEFHNWLHDKDGYTIIQNSVTGYYVWADYSGKSIVATDYRIDLTNPKDLGIPKYVNISNEEYLTKKENFFGSSRDLPVNAPTQGSLNNLVVFIRFSGETEYSQNISVYESMFNSQDLNANSMKNYFKEASYQSLTINSTYYPNPISNMVVSFQDIYPRSYYSPYSVTNTNGYTDDTQRTTREHTLLKRAVLAIASSVPSSLNLDGDNDGYVDNVCFVIKGTAGEWANLLWPHQWSLYSETVNINGKQVYDYNFQLQDFLSSEGNSVLAHEMFHTLGAPDLYRYVTAGEPIGSWDLMSTNTNPPQHMSVYMKYRYGTWISDIPVISTSGTYTINSIKSATNNCYRINSPNSTTEFFVVEFRKNNNGTFDSQLSGSGLVVYRVNSLADGEGNAQGPPDELYVYRPGGTTTSDGTIQNAFFSLESGRTQINDSTNPSSFLSNGSPSGLVINNIGSSNSLNISFNVQFTETIITEFPWVEGFEDAFPPTGWTQVDQDGDTYRWFELSGTAQPHSGLKCAASASYLNDVGVLTPDNWLISPKIQLPVFSANQSAQLKFWVAAYNASWPAEHYSVLISNSQNPASFIPLYSETLQNTTWIENTISLAEYSGQDVYIAFRHHSVSDMFYLKLDDVSVELMTTPVFLPPGNLTANVNNRDVTLNWSSPDIQTLNDWITYSDSYNSGVGLDAAAEFMVAQRYTNSQLVQIGAINGQLTKVRFIGHEPTATYTIKIWTGGSENPYNPGNLVLSQLVSGTISPDVWTEVILNTPINIPVTGELWIGYNVNTPLGFPAGADAGPSYDGYSNLIYLDNQWSTLFSLAPAMNYNWCIGGYITGMTNNIINLPTTQISSRELKNNNINNKNLLKSISFSSLNTNPNPVRNLLGYNVFRGNTLLNQTPLSTNVLTYLDQNLDNGEYTYSVTAVYSNGESIPVSVTATVTSGGLYQEIYLSNGWNIFSVNRLSDASAISDVLSSLRNNNQLVKVMNESGQSYEYLSEFSQWIDNIGSISTSEGYYIKVNTNLTMNVTGTSTITPLTIPLINGWNIISYPYDYSQPALPLLQSLINNNQLVKVMNESGQAIEYHPVIGWINNINSFQPGEGYSVKVNQNVDFVYPNQRFFPNLSQNLSIINRTPKHFLKVWTGNGFKHFNVYIINNDYLKSILSSGDEIALYDGEFCVSSLVINGNEDFFSLIASLNTNDQSNNNGYSINHPFSIRIFNQNNEYKNIDYSIISGTNLFNIGESAVITINNLLANNDILIPKLTEIQSIYPNPFNPSTTIQYSINKNDFVEIDIYNVKGQKIKSLISQKHTPGIFHVVWNGKDLNEKSVSSGIYMCRIKTSNKIISKKMILVK